MLQAESSQVDSYSSQAQSSGSVKVKIQGIFGLSAKPWNIFIAKKIFMSNLKVFFLFFFKSSFLQNLHIAVG